MAESLISRYELHDLSHSARRRAKHVWRHFREDRSFEEAASLGYTSLLAIVPLLAVIFGIASAFPVFSEWSIQLKLFLFANLMPAAGVQIEEYLNRFLSSAGSLTLPGTITLIFTALLLMLRIEIALNRIWRVDRKRSLTNRIVMYWAVLTLGPLLIGAAVAISLQNVFQPIHWQGWVIAMWDRVGVFVISWTVFTLLFVLVPNRKVRLRDALIGAFVSAVLFELAKVGFVTYVKNANFNALYGALATLPIFLFWLYLVWVVILLGASLAASLTTFDDTQRSPGEWIRKRDFQLLFRLVGHLRGAQKQGQKISDTELLLKEPKAGERQILELLHNLEQARIVTRDEAGDWLLSRDTADLTLGDLYDSGNYHLPVTRREAVPVETEWDAAFEKTIQRIQMEGLAGLECPLQKLYQSVAHGSMNESHS